MMHTCKISLLFTLLIFYHATDQVYAAHFRGGVIMVRPKTGGAPKEVSATANCIHYVAIPLANWLIRSYPSSVL